MEDMEESSGATVSGTSLEQEMSIVAMGMSNELKEKKDSLVKVIVASTESEHKVPFSVALAIFGIVPGPRVDSVVQMLWVYFPVPEHLDRARKGEDYGVAYQPPFG